MNKLLKYPWLMVCIILVLLGFTLLIGFHFFQDQTVPEIEKGPIVLPEDDELIFTNHSSMSNDEIWKLITTKQDELRTLFFNSKVYLPSSILSSMTSEDDEKAIVFDDTFLITLNNLVVDDIYAEILNKMTFLKEDVNHKFYIADRDIFESIYLDSAIAEVGITSSELRLITATDEKINASVTVSICMENDCNIKTSFPLEVQKINGLWKVSAFQK